MRIGGGSGFTLIEVLVALAVLMVAVGGLASVAMVTGRSTVDARGADVAQRAAVEKLEQLRSLSWTGDGGTVPVSDWSTDLTGAVVSPAGGRGLGVSPGDTLAASVSGFSDVLDADGRWLAAGPASPRGAAWERRWSVQLMAVPTDTLVLQVVVVPAHVRGTEATLAAAGGRPGTWLVDLRTRRSR